MTGHVPVIIVGAGPVGVTAATLLARRGIASVLLEKYQAPYPLPRAVHLDDEVARILQAAGVAEQFAKVSRPMPGMRLVDAQHKTMAEFNRAGAHDDDRHVRGHDASLIVVRWRPSSIAPSGVATCSSTTSPWCR